MPVKLSFRGRQFEVPAGTTVRQAMLKAGLQPELVLATRDGELLTEDIILREGEHVRFVAVISGGGASAWWQSIVSVPWPGGERASRALDSLACDSISARQATPSQACRRR